MYLKKILILTIILILFIPLTSFANFSDINTLSPSCILIDSNSGKILYEKNSQKQMYIASTTKIMTAILTIENCSLSDIATVSSNAVSLKSVPPGYTKANLQAGESFTIEQLLNVLLIPSANDAANVLAEHVSGSVEEFCVLMNKKAAELGCKNTNFVNPNGIHNDNHYSTAYDLALISNYAMKNATFRSFVCKTSCVLPATDIYKKNDREFETTNELLKKSDNNNFNYFYEYTTGIKTGYTTIAKNCIVASAKKDNLEFIAVILGADNNNSKESKRAIDCINLFNYAINNYNDKKFLSKDTIIKQLEINTNKSVNDNSKKQVLDIVPEHELIVRTDLNPDDISPTITLQPDLHAPILKGMVVGKIEYNIDDINYSVNLIANNNIIDSVYVQYLFDLLLIILLIIILFSFLHSIHKKSKKK